MKRKICVITGTRADYGLLKCVMQLIRDDVNLSLQVVASGMHLSSEFGLTYRVIERDGFTIDHKVEMLLSSDSSLGIAKSMGLGLIGYAEALDKLKPDLVLLLGDRFEIFVAASAALVARIPIGHIHGGEATEGLIDEAIRHSLTKMSHLHFVAAEAYRRRVIQLGEHPSRVFLVGSPGLDNIEQLKLLNKVELEDALSISFRAKSLVITFHPVTLDKASAEAQMAELLNALSGLSDTTLIFTLPNADNDGRVLISMIENFVKKYPNAVSFTSLGQLLYLSCIANCDAVIGNSSSGLLEAPSFKKPTINIGDRQKGRLRASSVIDCDPVSDAITSAITLLYSKQFQSKLADVVNPYGAYGASSKIVSILKEVMLEGLIKKKFYDLDLM